jgi:hypothetical protein
LKKSYLVCLTPINVRMVWLYLFSAILLPLSKTDSWRWVWHDKEGLGTISAKEQRPDISFIWRYYILSISRPPKRILYPITITAKKKDMDIYPISFVKNFASIVTVSEQQKAQTGSTAAHKSSTFYRIELKSISSTARKWQRQQC